MTTQDQKFWENYFKVYDTLNEFIPYQEMIEAVVDITDPQPGDRILDAGCGTGNVAIRLAKDGVKVVGIDAIREALDLYKKKKPDAEIFQMDITKTLAFSNETFNKCVLNNVVYSLDSRETILLLENLKKVIKSGGLLFVSHPKKEFSSVILYICGVKMSLRKYGMWKTLLSIAKQIIPTIKILYYNKKLKNTKIKNSHIGSQLIDVFLEHKFTLRYQIDVYCNQSNLFVFQNDN